MDDYSALVEELGRLASQQLGGREVNAVVDATGFVDPAIVRPP